MGMNALAEVLVTFASFAACSSASSTQCQQAADPQSNHGDSLGNMMIQKKVESDLKQNSSLTESDEDLSLIRVKESKSRCFSCADGLTAYAQIEANLGRGSIESPDYNTGTLCNTDVTHVKCSSTSTWPSRIFKFFLDLEKDCEPVANKPDRQRNEIKVYAKSDDILKGFHGSTMLYSWKFRVHSSMLVSRKFTHIFQLKFVGGDSQKPAVTFTGGQRSGESLFQLRNTSFSNMRENVLATVPWSDVTGRWLSASVKVTMLPMESGGRLQVDVTRVDNGKSLISLDEPAGLWRPGNEFMRPKWGIYRQSEHLLIQEGDLNDARVYFTDFCIERTD